MKSVVILISGRGSNMVRIATACRDEQWPARISAVISNEPRAAGLSAARDLGIPTRIVPHRDHADREAFDAALAAQIDAHAPDLVILAGFMRILTPGFVTRYQNRLINIHPSLLPAFPGLHTHARAIAAGVKVHGATVHYVTAELDAGPIIAQAVVPVFDADTADSLQARVQQAEHRLYPAAVRWHVGGQISVHDGVTRLAAAGPAALGLAAPGPAVDHGR
ncbi:MAG: phosphoribosylglycinamide formyltransferase [Burkholderiaceae bacterium]